MPMNCPKLSYSLIDTDLNSPADSNIF